MTHHAPRSCRILIATASPVEGQAIETMISRHIVQRPQPPGPAAVRVTSDSREIPALYAKWPYRVLVLDAEAGPLPTRDVLGTLAARIDGSTLSVVLIASERESPESAQPCTGLDVIHRPFAGDELRQRVQRALSGALAPSHPPSSGH